MVDEKVARLFILDGETGAVGEKDPFIVENRDG